MSPTDGVKISGGPHPAQVPAAFHLGVIIPAANGGEGQTRWRAWNDEKSTAAIAIWPSALRTSQGSPVLSIG
jgi:hypothetical protein